MDAISRAERHFGGTAPTTQELDAYYQTTLKTEAPHLWPQTPTQAAPRSTLEAVAAKHGMTVEQWEMIGHIERSARERQWLAAHGQAPGPRQKQGNYIATGAELKDLEGKSPAERATYGHERTQQQREQRP